MLKIKYSVPEKLIFGRNSRSQDTYEELINRINELIDYNRKYVVPKKGSKSEDEDGGDDEDGGSSEDGEQQDGGSSDVTPVTPEPTPSGGSGGGDE